MTLTRRAASSCSTNLGQFLAALPILHLGGDQRQYARSRRISLSRRRNGGLLQYIPVSPNDTYATLASWASLILRSCSSQQCGQRTRILTD
jgi:hypothetical protein